ncbi:hypothetical protein DCS_00986 [Drechmeria coniospora]|uniref:Phospholipase/carboxylesterase/thioesterase domain-containing protein n=1 Tax=Drechmeria coniospora TaxID=98403 RepID=A0A151GS66_DRECN|nr:hypothetical protein DCS_00986 [Drechmeria coniospora]KYK59852.1 hypothetical protein DCS_00986 [Drechmeria coniospora]
MRTSTSWTCGTQVPLDPARSPASRFLPLLPPFCIIVLLRFTSFVRPADDCRPPCRQDQSIPRTHGSNRWGVQTNIIGSGRAIAEEAYPRRGGGSVIVLRPRHPPPTNSATLVGARQLMTRGRFAGTSSEELSVRPSSSSPDAMATTWTYREPYFGRCLNPPMIVQPRGGTHTHTVILLHGVASNGHIFGHDLLTARVPSSSPPGSPASSSSIFPQNGRTLDVLFPSVRWVFPTAFRHPCTAIESSRVTLWFDVASLTHPAHQQALQRRGLSISSRELIAIIHSELRRVPASNIIIGGQGQGCALSLVVLLCLGYRLGGFVGMSGFVPFQFELDIFTAIDSSTSSSSVSSSDDDYDDDDDDAEKFIVLQGPPVEAQIFMRHLLGMTCPPCPARETTAYRTPVLLSHGVDDPIISCSRGEQAAISIRAAGYQVDFRAYDQHGHGLKVPDQIDDIIHFFRTRVGLQARAGRA